MIEVAGFVLAIAMVICNTRQLVWGWPLSIASSALYLGVFAQSKLYGDAALQIVFIALALWGWYQWQRGASVQAGEPLRSLQPRSMTQWQTAGMLLLWLILGGAIAELLRRFTDSDAAVLDAFVTAGSLVATVLLARKLTANWLVWLAVNVVSVALLLSKQLWLSALLYAVLAILSVHGWLVWRKAHG